MGGWESKTSLWEAESPLPLPCVAFPFPLREVARFLRVGEILEFSTLDDFGFMDIPHHRLEFAHLDVVGLESNALIWILPDMYDPTATSQLPYTLLWAQNLRANEFSHGT